MSGLRRTEYVGGSLILPNMLDHSTRLVGVLKTCKQTSSLCILYAEEEGESIG